MIRHVFGLRVAMGRIYTLKGSALRLPLGDNNTFAIGGAGSGVQVVEAQRPSDGWTKETSQEISQALAQVTNQGTENVKSVLIMIVKD